MNSCNQRAVNPGATRNLNESLNAGARSYNTSSAITAYALEARNENALYVKNAGIDSKLMASIPQSHTASANCKLTL